MRLPFVTMRSSRTAAAVALVAATVIAMPSATAVSSAPARGAAPGDWTGPVIEIWQKAYWLSPNGDRVQDKTRIEFSLDKPAKVTVKVRRQNERRTLVYKEELGRFVGNSSENIWTWKGKDGHGDVVRDGRYTAIFVAEQIGPDGKKRARSTNVYVDTRFDPPKAPVLSVDTLYPRTTQIQDALAVTLAKRGPMASVSWAELRVRDSRGGLVRTTEGNTDWWNPVTLVFDGRDRAGAPLPGGRYKLGFKVKDQAGNVGKPKAVTVTVSDRPLVERTETLVVPPTGSWSASQLDAVSARAGGNDPVPVPCGVVVPSEVYPEPGASSFRSADTCSGEFRPNIAMASGYLTLDNLTAQVAPRGLWSQQVSMRGRPTVAGESDTAELWLGGYDFGLYAPPSRRGISSQPTTEETVTSTETLTAQPKPFYSTASNPPRVDWAIATRGVDSYDVADVTVRYSYLTPPSS